MAVTVIEEVECEYLEIRRMKADAAALGEVGSFTALKSNLETLQPRLGLAS
jgi:hypothetical protein